MGNGQNTLIQSNSRHCNTGTHYHSCWKSTKCVSSSQ